MLSSWKRRRAARRAGKDGPDAAAGNGGLDGGDIEVAIPNHFRCPISLDLMKDPVTLSTGMTYDRESIEKWIESGKITCPITNQVLRSLDPIPNHTIRRMIQDWCVDNGSNYGIERIPTPKIPVSSVEVLEIQSKIAMASEARDVFGCKNLLSKVKRLMKESERNKRCIVSNGTATVLSAAFEELSKQYYSSCNHENVLVLDEILSTLTLMFPLTGEAGGEAKNYLASIGSVNCLVWFLTAGDFSRRGNAVLVLKEIIVSMDERKIESLSRIEGAAGALFKLIKEPICPSATKASLTIIHNMVTTSSSSSSSIAEKFVNLGLVSLLLEMIVDSDRRVCENALGVLDGICGGSDKGREEACNHALAIPVLVKKIHRVSDTATEFSVSVLWRLCKNGGGGGVVVEALQVGVFQKLLLLLQVGCGERTKEKATELLKVLNVHRRRLECIESMDFKDLKRAF